MNDTPTDSLARAKEFADEAAKLPGVQSCAVDDWASDGFYVLLFPKKMAGLFGDKVWTGEFAQPLRGLMTRVHGLLRKHDGCLEWFDGPEMQYTWDPIYAKKRRDHYNRDYYKLSIRFPSHE